MKVIALHKSSLDSGQDASLTKAQELERLGCILIDRAATMNGGMRMLRGLLPLLIPSSPDKTVLVFKNLLACLIYSGNETSKAQAREAIELIGKFAEINPATASAPAPLQAEN